MPPPGGMTVRTKAVELRVEGVTTAAEIGGRSAKPGYEFVIVDASWKNIIPLTPVDRSAASNPTAGFGGFGSRKPSSDPANITMESTLYVVPMLKKQVWVFTDERFADTVDLAAQTAVPNHLSPDGFSMAKLDDVARGTLVFEVPAGAHYRTFQFYDNDHGHALIPLGGTKPAAAPPAVGSPRQSELLQLTLSEAGFGPPGAAAPAGLRYYTVGLSGISRSPKDIVEIQFGQYVFLQNERGCVSQPEHDVAGLTRPFGDLGSFPPTSRNEGQVPFLVPDDTKNARVLIVPTRGGAITLPAGADFTPSWPAPVHTFQDGQTMRVHILPKPARPATLHPPADGREHLLLDVVVENLVANRGIEFQGTQQLRLVDPAGGFTSPSPLSLEAPCRLDGAGVIPGGNARRFTLVYDVPAGQAWRLQYRGFETGEETIDLH